MTTKPETRATMLEALKAAEFAGALTCCCPNDKWFTCWACKARAAIAEAEQTETRATRKNWKYTVNVGPTKGLILEEDGSTIMECHNTARSGHFEKHLQTICRAVNSYNNQFEPRATKQLLLTEIIERYPRMVRLLTTAESQLEHKDQDSTQAHYYQCVKCQIQALLVEVEK